MWRSVQPVRNACGVGKRANLIVGAVRGRLCDADAAVLSHAGACWGGRYCWAYFSPQPICTSQVSTDLTVILTKTITGPVSAIALSPLRVQCHRRYPRCLLSQVSETRTLLLKLMGSDPQAPPAQWEVVSGLEPWLTINGFHVSTALPGALPGAKRATAVVVAPLFRSQGLTYII